MTEYFFAVILGLVEGITEFLPISSTGHLILVNQWIAFSPSFTKVFDVVIQFGAVLAVVVVFWRKLLVLDTWKKMIVAVIPAIVIGVLFGSRVTAALFDPIVVAIALIAGGLVLFFVEHRRHTESIREMKKLSYQRAFLIGLTQCLAFIPGISRSAATILGALLLGASRSVAAEFSFFLAIPTLAAASGYSLIKHPVALSSHEIVLLVIGFVVAFLAAFAVIRVFMAYVQKKTFLPFAYYRIALGLLIVLLFAW